MIETAIQPACSPHLADPAFDAIAKTAGRTEPALLFLPTAARGLVSRFGQAHAADAQASRLAFILWGMRASVTTQLMWRMTKELAMVLHTGDHLPVIGRIAFKQAILRNQAAVHFAKPHLAAELGVFGLGFAATDNGGVRLEQAHHFVTRRNGVALQHPPTRLRHHTLQVLDT
jgi:hypothetical protein